MKQVIIFPRGQLSEIDKARLLAQSIIAIEADDPSKVVSVLPSASIVSPDDLLMAALAGIKSAGGGNTMVSELLNRLKAKATP